MAKDRGRKLRIYAERGVPEYWIVDVVSRRVVVHRDPAGGTYRSTRVFERHESIELLRFPDVSVLLSDVLKG
jgi:Uma2 family endonuclease